MLRLHDLELSTLTLHNIKDDHDNVIKTPNQYTPRRHDYRIAVLCVCVCVNVCIVCLRHLRVSSFLYVPRLFFCFLDSLLIQIMVCATRHRGVQLA